MQHGWGDVCGIGVDSHVLRISRRLGWHDAATAEAARRRLQAWLPAAQWAELNTLLVGFGQQASTAN